jgi:hypothetical protein
VFFVHPDKKNALTHKVNPINSRMLQCLFDYGSLSRKVERKYVDAIFGEFKKHMEDHFWNVFVETVVNAQEFIKKKVSENESSVSLRDIKRVKKLFIFYCYLIKFRNSYKEIKQKIKEERRTNGEATTSNSFDHFMQNNLVNFKEISDDELFIAFIVSISLCYLYRIIKTSKTSNENINQRT